MAQLTWRRLRVSALVTAGIVVAATAGLPAGAWAGSRLAAATSRCTPANLPGARTLAEKALAKRALRIQALGARVAAAKQLSAADLASLTGDLAAELSGVKALQAKVPGDTDCATVVADAQAMVTDYRVYTVMSPQVHIVIAADTETAVVTRFSGLEPTISARITAAQAAGVTVASAQATFSDFTSQVASALQASSGVATSVLAVTPADFPASHQTFEAATSALGTGRTALERADADLHTLKADARAERRAIR